MKIAILGASGFIGKHVTRRLISEGLYCVGIDKNPIGIRSSLLDSIACDFSDLETIVPAINQCDVLIHAISTTVPATSVRNRIYDIESNLINTVKLIEKFSKTKKLRVIFLSSGGTVYGEQKRFPVNESMSTNPVCSYGIVKLAIEKYLMEFDRDGLIDALILRISNPYGTGVDISKGQGVVPTFVDAMIEGRKIRVAGNGEVLKDYIYIDDLVEAIYRAISYTGLEKIINISTSVGTSLNQLIETIHHFLAIDYEIEFIEKSIYDCGHNILDSSLAEVSMSWKANTDIKTGIARYLNDRKKVSV